MNSRLKVDFKEKKEYYVEIMKGFKEGKQIFIVDENNNKDFTDDPIREYKSIDWNKLANLSKCEFLISDDREILKYSPWLNVGDSHGAF